MAERTIRLGFLRYRGDDGGTHLGFIGETVDVHEDDLGRFDALNPEAETVPDSASELTAEFTKDDVDAAVEAAELAKDAELDQVRQAIEAEVAALALAKDELARDREAFEAQKAAASESKPEPEPEKKASARKPVQS